MHMHLSKLQEIVKDREALCVAVHGVTESDTTVWLNKEPASVFPVGFYSSSWDVRIIVDVSVLVCYINIKYYAFVYLKDELDWGRLNYIQIKRIREVSCIFFERK